MFSTIYRHNSVAKIHYFLQTIICRLHFFTQRFGKNAILRGLNFEEGATAKERNEQIGGHRA